MKVFLAAVLLVGICMLLLGIGILFRRGFPQYDIGSNEKLKARGIVCYKDEDAALHKPRACSGNYSDACKTCSLYGQTVIPSELPVIPSEAKESKKSKK